MSFLDTPSSVLSLGPRGHAALLHGRHKEVQGVMRSADWTCCKCGVRVPDAMEIHHPEGHSPTGKLAVICTFCHYPEHAGWAAGRSLISGIWAPDLSQADVSRLCWGAILAGTLLSQDEDDEHQEASASLARVCADLAARVRIASERVGADLPSSVIESAFRLRSQRGKSADLDKMIDAHLSRVVAGLRWAPTGVAMPRQMRPCFVSWDLGGIVTVDDDVRAAVIAASGPVSVAALREEISGHMGDLPEPEAPDPPEYVDDPASAIGDIDWSSGMDGV